GNRIPTWEKSVSDFFHLPAHPGNPDFVNRQSILTGRFEPMLQRELVYRGIVSENKDYRTKLIGWIEIISKL
ncbi:TPA: hypothetical protein ACSBDN_004601, partial [Shigella sonnei]